MADRNFYSKGRLADIVGGSDTFAAYLAAHFAALSITEEQSDAFGLLNTSLQSCWSASTNPATRTPVAVEATRDAITAMRAAAIPLAKQIVGNPAVSDSQLVAMGLLPRSGRTPSHLITEVPVLTVLKVQGRQVTIRVRGTTRGKLPAAVGAVVYSATGDAPPATVSGWTSEGPITKDTAIIEFEESAVGVGDRVWFVAQWFNSKGVGPGCPPVQAIINADTSMAA